MLRRTHFSMGNSTLLLQKQQQQQQRHPFFTFHLNTAARCFDVEVQWSSSSGSSDSCAASSKKQFQVPFVFLSDHSITNTELATLQRSVPVDYRRDQLFGFEFSDFVTINWRHRLVFFERMKAVRAAPSPTSVSASHVFPTSASVSRGCNNNSNSGGASSSSSSSDVKHRTNRCDGGMTATPTCSLVSASAAASATASTSPSPLSSSGSYCETLAVPCESFLHLLVAGTCCKDVIVSSAADIRNNTNKNNNHDSCCVDPRRAAVAMYDALHKAMMDQIAVAAAPAEGKHSEKITSTSDSATVNRTNTTTTTTTTTVSESDCWRRFVDVVEEEQEEGKQPTATVSPSTTIESDMLPANLKASNAELYQKLLVIHEGRRDSNNNDDSDNNSFNLRDLRTSRGLTAAQLYQAVAAADAQKILVSGFQQRAAQQRTFSPFSPLTRFGDSRAAFCSPTLWREKDILEQQQQQHRNPTAASVFISDVFAPSTQKLCRDTAAASSALSAGSSKKKKEETKETTMKKSKQIVQPAENEAAAALIFGAAIRNSLDETYRLEKTRQVVDAIDKYGFCVVEDPVLSIGMPHPIGVNAADEPNALPASGLLRELADNTDDPVAQLVVWRRNATDFFMRYLFGVVMSSQYGSTPLWGRFECGSNMKQKKKKKQEMSSKATAKTSSSSSGKQIIVGKQKHELSMMEGEDFKRLDDDGDDVNSVSNNSSSSSDMMTIDHSDTAYMSHGIDLHTDATYLCVPPKLQGFGVVHWDDASGSRGGVNSLVDGFAVAEFMSHNFPREFDTLCRTPVQCVYAKDGRATAAHRPVFSLAAPGHLQQVSFNAYDRAPSVVFTSPSSCSSSSSFSEQALSREQQQAAVPPARDIELFYSALSLFADLCHGSVGPADFMYSLQPKIGKILIFDNHRCLHARTAFHGPRIMCGSYITEDDYLSQLNHSRLSRGDEPN